MAKLINLIPANSKPKQNESFEDPLEGFPTAYKELLKKLQRSNNPAERTMLINKMNVIRKNIKLKPLTNEALEDMDVKLPSTVERFLDRVIKVIKSYNLPRKKEQAVIARVIDALNINPSELSQTIQKLKKYDIVHREGVEKKTGNAEHDFYETLKEETAYQKAGFAIPQIGPATDKNIEKWKKSDNMSRYSRYMKDDVVQATKEYKKWLDINVPVLEAILKNKSYKTFVSAMESGGSSRENYDYLDRVVNVMKAHQRSFK